MLHNLKERVQDLVVLSRTCGIAQSIFCIETPHSRLVQFSTSHTSLPEPVQRIVEN